MGAEMSNTIVGALLGAILSALFAALGYFGYYEIADLKQSIIEAQRTIQTNACAVNVISIRDQLEDIERQMLGNFVDNIRLNGRKIHKLDELLAASKPAYLDQCDTGREITAQINALDQGLVAYAEADYTKAIERFSALPPNRAVAQQLLGAAKLKASQQLVPGTAAATMLRREADKNFANMLRMAQVEVSTTTKEASLVIMKCTYEGVSYPGDKAQTEKAITCFNDEVITKHIENADTYYQVAALKARLGDFGGALVALRKCLDKGGSLTTSARFIRDDDDFAHLSKSQRYHRQFEQLVAQFGS